MKRDQISAVEPDSPVYKSLGLLFDAYVVYLIMGFY